MSFKKTEQEMSATILLEDPQPIRRGSTASIEPLEDIVTCPIHLDLLNNPRILPCGHAFCMDCLSTCLQSLAKSPYAHNSSVFTCPVCRAESAIPPLGASGWPLAFTQAHIVEFVKDQRVKQYARNLATSTQHVSTTSNNPLSSTCPPSSSTDSTHHNLHDATSIHHARPRKGSLIAKADLLKTLAEEIACHQNHVVDVDKTIVINDLHKLLDRLKASDASPKPTDIIESTTVKMETTLAPVADCGAVVDREALHPPIRDKRGSYEIQCEVETARHMMRQCCSYHVKKMPPSLPTVPGDPHHNMTLAALACPLDLGRYGDARSICVDLDLTVNSGPRRVFVDASGMVVNWNRSTNRVTRFRPCLGDGIFHPIHLRLVNSTLIISGLLNKDEQVKVGLVIRCDMDGTLLAKSKEYPADNEEYLPVQGFDVDLESEEILLAKPSEKEIVILNSALVETDQHWVFSDPDLSPSYLCRFKTDGEIWATCPRQSTIVILNEPDGRYSHFGTDKIFGSAPSHIICTTDERVCFLDDKEARVFWIRKRFDYLCIQRLSFGSKLNRTSNRLILPLVDGQILIVSDRQVYCAKPARTIPWNSKCNIL